MSESRGPRRRRWRKDVWKEPPPEGPFEPQDAAAAEEAAESEFPEPTPAAENRPEDETDGRGAEPVREDARDEQQSYPLAETDAGDARFDGDTASSEYRARHRARRRVVLPRPARLGRHSLGAPFPAAPERSAPFDVAEEPAPVEEDVPTQEPEEEAPTPEPGAAPTDRPVAESGSRRRSRGKHRASRLGPLLPPKAPRGRRLLDDAPPPGDGDTEIVEVDAIEPEPPPTPPSEPEPKAEAEVIEPFEPEPEAEAEVIEPEPLPEPEGEVVEPFEPQAEAEVIEPEPLPEPEGEVVEPFEPQAEPEELPPEYSARAARPRGRHLRRSAVLLPRRSKPGRRVARDTQTPAELAPVDETEDAEAAIEPEDDAPAPEAATEAIEPEDDAPAPEVAVEAIEEEAEVVDEEFDPAVALRELFQEADSDDLAIEEDLEEIFPPARRSRRERRRERRRTEKPKRVRKRGRGRQVVAGALSALIVAGATVAAEELLSRPQSDPERESSASGPAALPATGGDVVTLLAYGTRESDEGRGVLWASLLAYDTEASTASIIYIPAHTAVEAPGRGLLSLGDTLVSGGPALMLLSTETLLGVDKIDGYVEVSDQDARALFDATGEMVVDVPHDVRVPAGPDQARIIFVEGPQELDAPFLTRLLYTRGLEVDDVEFGARMLAFWDAFLERFAGDRAELGLAIRNVGTALSSDLDVDELAAFFESLASVPGGDLTLTSLPVRSISAGDSELYTTDANEMEGLLEAALGSDSGETEEVRVQVLNGNGVPGIGQQVAERLGGEDFRVILSGNARSLDYETTLIVTYDDSEEGLALAERARALLGVGEVQVSAQEQGIVDLTIVVGKDFVGAE